MFDIKKLTEHAIAVDNQLKRTETDWQPRYDGYIKSLDLQKIKLPFRRSIGELTVYINISQANINVNSETYNKYFLRYLGQTIAEITYYKKEQRVILSTYGYADKNKRDFEYDGGEFEVDWKSETAKLFREHFRDYTPRSSNSKRKNEEHRIQNLFFRELAKQRGENKALKFTQPVKLLNCFFEMPVPISGSAHNIETSKRDGHIDILATIRHGNQTRVGVIEVKDENKPNESIGEVFNQAVTYACCIRRLLKSKEGKKWSQLFGYTKPIKAEDNGLIIDAVAAMPKLSEIDTKQFDGRNKIRIPIDSDFIELNFISFEEANNILKILKTSWTKR